MTPEPGQPPIDDDDAIAIDSRDASMWVPRAPVGESDARFRQLVETASDGVYRVDSRGVFTYVNPIVMRLLGVAPNDTGVVGTICLRFVRRDHHAPAIALYSRQMRERIPVTYWEFPVVARDGRELWIGQNLHLEEQAGDAPTFFAVARDITARKKAEAALRTSEAHYRFLVEQSPDMLSRQSADGRVLYASPACAALLGYTSAELIGTSVFEICHPDDVPLARAVHARLLDHGTSETLTFRARRREGSYVWLETMSRVTLDPTSGALEVLSVTRDVTERRRMEADLRQAQKMEAIGQLAGGVAHDFNNLLTSIRGFSDLLARTIAPDDPRRRDVGEIFKATERAVALTRQLLAFSKRQVLRAEPIDVNGVVDGMAKIIGRLLGRTIRVEARLDPAVWPVRVDPGQLEQVLLNIALNARDAMPDAGVFRITTRNTVVAPAGAPDVVIPPGRYVALELTDSGHGMGEDVRARVFEPFYTTKHPNDGAGLGLATVYGIITQSGGYISVTSAVGVGTTFTIHLPFAAEHATAGAQSSADTQRSAGGNTILMADDNEGVRALTMRLLVDAGYRVYECRDGVEAVETLNALKEPVDLLITDALMPRMNGSELAAHFHRVQPGTPVLLMSGYMDEATVRRSFNEPNAVLSKPFSAEALLERVAELIGIPR